MRSMSRVERFFERLVERPSARLFRTRLQPVQVLRRIERAMEAGRESVADNSIAPDRFLVRVNPVDLPSLGPLDGVAADLASGALAFARSHRLVVADRPRVAIHPDATVRRGEVDVEAAISPQAAPDPGSGDAGTRVFTVPIVRAPSAVLDIREPGRPPRRIAVGAEPLRIGRAADCELRLHDRLVSRLHARVHARDGVLVLTDLGSTNGTRVNGQGVREVVLGAGDRIAIGGTTLVVSAGTEDPATGSP
jgi:Protein of unknown function (DUF3662)/Inner membrane component of T3SS, cytoplasmic domain